MDDKNSGDGRQASLFADADPPRRVLIREQARDVAAGNIKAEIVRAAQEQQSDLIVLGCRERRGPSILVNFTEDTVLHAAPCDVLAVRIAKASA